MKVKAKGLNAERELVRMFNERGWRSVRVAGSGSIKYPAPDVIAARGSRRLVIECKTTKTKNQYLEKEQIGELAAFAEALLAEPWVGVRFDNVKWFFVSLEDLKKTPSGYVVSLADAKMKGLLFEELAGD
mgnify:CR=1 FL=1